MTEHPPTEPTGQANALALSARKGSAGHLHTDTSFHTGGGEPQRKTMSTLIDRIELAFSTLDEVVQAAEKAKTENAGVVSFANKVKGLVSFVDGLDETVKYQTLDAIGDLSDQWVQTFAGLQAISTKVGAAAGIDRTAGDESVKALQALLSLNAFDDMPTEKARAEDLIARWTASAPTKASGTRGEGKGVDPLGFTVTAICEHEGCNYTTTTEKDNLNSIRNEMKKHTKEAHKVLNVERGTPLHLGMTEGLDAVMHKDSDASQGGGFRFTKTAAA